MRQAVKLVREIWTKKGYKTKPIKHNESVYVLANSKADNEKELIQIGFEETLSERVVESLSTIRDDRGFDTAYFFATHTKGSTEIEQTEPGQLEYLSPEKISSLVQQLELERFISTEFPDAIPETSLPEPDSPKEGNSSSESTESPSESPSEPVASSEDSAKPGGDSVAKEERAAQIVSQAAGSSVTESRLLEQGSTGLLSTANLREAPLIEYLDTGENPQFIFQNELKGISIESNGAIQPAGDYRAFVVITDQRILCVIGQEDADTVVTIPYRELQSVESATGMLKHRITVSGDNRDIDLYIATEAIDDEDEVGSAEDFISARLGTETGSIQRITVDGQPLESVPSEEVEEEATTLEMVGAVAVLLMGSVIVLAILGGVVGVLTSSGDAGADDAEQQLIEKNPESLTLQLQQLDTGWKSYSGRTADLLETTEPNSTSVYWNPDESSQLSGPSVIKSEVVLPDTVNESKGVYSREVKEVTEEFAVENPQIGDEAVLFEDGNTIRVIFRHQNMVASVAYQKPMSIGFQKSQTKEFARDIVKNTK
ncbi:PH domain-containing protein [Halobacterium salinarum]|uniref:PH domain-containing protein n=1 Tax=Halobacterium salinarum TaxID=2242 RepID=UPI002555CC3C|nr:PH domain-containing protein [Halobacterium salinarum]MDL0130255.1 PH domain-containing protein [Halobacterium salinarum]